MMAGHVQGYHTLYACNQMHAQLSLYGLSLEEIYDVEPIERQVDTPVVEQDSVFVSCLQCKRQVRNAQSCTNLIIAMLTRTARPVCRYMRHDIQTIWRNA